MFNIKPAHVQMRNLLQAGSVDEFDRVFHAIEPYLSDWSKGVRERALAVALGLWITERRNDNTLKLSNIAIAKIHHLVGLASEFNERDVSGDGSAANHYAISLLNKWLDSSPAPKTPARTEIGREELLQRQQVLRDKLDRLK